MDIKQFQYFLALSRQENMSITAEILGISQPALSKSIRSLEKELGVELFERHGNRISLNENGRDFSEYASRILSDLEAGKRAMQQTRFDFRGTVRITCHAFADSIMDCVTDYMRLNPGVQIVLCQSQQGDEYIGEKVDFMLEGQLDTIPSSEWTARKLFTEQACIIISPRYRQYPEGTTSLAPIQLEDDLFICDQMYSEIFSFTYMDTIHRMCRSAGFYPKAVCYTDDFLTKIRMVDEGQGITVLPRSCMHIVRQLSPDIQVFDIDGFDTTRSVYLVKRKESQLSEAARDFWDFVTDHFGA